MTSHVGRRLRRFLLAAAIIGFAAIVPGGGEVFGKAKKEATEAPEGATAQRLVVEAHKSEIAGDAGKRYLLLREAVRLSPDFALPRWQLGQLRVDDQWMSVEEAQRHAAANPKQAQYSELRAQFGETPEGQLSLARWCRKNNLVEEAKFHWASVLAVDPNNEEAQRAMGVRWSNGRLLTRKQIAEEKATFDEEKKAEKQWSPTITQWRRDMAGTDAAKRDAALNEIRAIAATDAIHPIEAVTLGRDSNRDKSAREREAFSLAFLEALAKMDTELATESLTRHAVFSDAAEVRKNATENLKKRSLHEYVPMLLSGLSMPIETSFQVTNSPDGSVRYTHSLYREGPEHDWSFDLRRAVVQADLGSDHFAKDVYTNKVYKGRNAGAIVANAINKAKVASNYQGRFTNSAVATEQHVGEINGTVEMLNSLVIAVLTGTTGQDLGQNPKAWWDWWRNHNEYHASNEREVDRYYNSDVDSYYYGQTTYSTFSTAPPPPPLPPGRSGSCFAKGTVVWTKTGQRPIETLELGDLVLSQNVESGELAYKPIIGRTVRPPTEIINLKLRSETIRTTRGHPFWIAGTGWRMAKELEKDALLHGVAGAEQINALESSEQEEAFNLVVADFNTYFVGESGVLVHDNTPRNPTRAAVPGIVAE